MGIHVLYAFLVPIKTSHNHVILKIGYSEDIVERIKTLELEYKTPIFLLKLKCISGRKDEQNFHNMIRKIYPELIEQYSIGDKNKVELYKLNPKILHEFDNYLINENTLQEKQNLTIEEIEIVQNIKTQDIVFLNYINKFYKTLTTSNNAIDQQLHLQYLTNKENHYNERWKIEKNIELTKLQNEAKSEHLDKETKLAEILSENLSKQIELVKLTNSDQRKNSKDKHIIKL